MYLILNYFEKYLNIHIEAKLRKFKFYHIKSTEKKNLYTGFRGFSQVSHRVSILYHLVPSPKSLQSSLNHLCINS